MWREIGSGGKKQKRLSVCEWDQSVDKIYIIVHQDYS